ncbi:MAG TPA: Uma2 family endonuclease [Polyangiaceae bacterium]|nr:Uma2 family endonuclease [Polyangiaceae bacterium]
MQSADPQPPATEGGVLVQHRVPGFSESWIIPEQPVPEAAWHDRALALFRALLECWIARTGRNAAVFRNIAVRVFEQAPRVGFDPDLCVVEPAPPAAEELSSVRLWDPGHGAPAFVLEVVSPGHPYKDYAEVPDRCAAMGVSELVIFDPLLVGPKAFGGPLRLQVWRRVEGPRFLRVAEGEGPFFSAFLNAHLVTTEGGRRLRIADDADGSHLWPTGEELERQQKDAERQQREAERLEKERALARIRELEAELARRGG